MEQSRDHTVLDQYLKQNVAMLSNEESNGVETMKEKEMEEAISLQHEQVKSKGVFRTRNKGLRRFSSSSTNPQQNIKSLVTQSVGLLLLPSQTEVELGTSSPLQTSGTSSKETMTDCPTLPIDNKNIEQLSHNSNKKLMTSDSIESTDESVDFTKISRASVGSQFSRFFIGSTSNDFASDDDSSEQESDEVLSIKNVRVMIERKHEKELVTDSSNDEFNEFSTMISNSSQDDFLLPTGPQDAPTFLPLAHRRCNSLPSSLDILSKVTRRATYSTNSEFLSHNAKKHNYNAQLLLNKDKLPVKQDETHRIVERSIMTEVMFSRLLAEDMSKQISPRNSTNNKSPLVRKHSMSESDIFTKFQEKRLSKVEPTSRPEKEKHGFLRRKFAMRKKSSDTSGRKYRTQSMLQVGSEIEIKLALAPNTPPELPHRRLHLGKEEYIPELRTHSPMIKRDPQNVKEMKESRSYSILPKKYKLHNPKNAEKLRTYLKRGTLDQVEKDQNSDTPLHAIVRTNRKDKTELLLVLMVHSDYGTEEIDFPAMYGNTALHLAVHKNDVSSAKILLSFGANLNSVNDHHKSPFDILSSQGWTEQNREMWELFLSLDAMGGSNVKQTTRLPRLLSLSTKLQEHLKPSKKLSTAKQEDVLSSQVSPVHMAQQLETNMNEMYKRYETIYDLDTQMALGLQQFELQGWKATGESPIRFQIHGGSRILCLDGGGIRGLIQIEILSMLERRTGRKITELFDWIVGTSTGGIVALGLVYGNKSLAELRQFYFKLKEEVFAKSRFGLGNSGNTTLALEDILRDVLGCEMRMCDVKQPKVLVSAVNKTTTKPVLHFFNNCFENEYSNEYIWKVARYTSAAPTYFSELDGYIDGGVLANNPADYGLTVIQNFHQYQGQTLDIACVVSIGTGIFPAEELGNTDVHEMFTGKNILNIQMLQRRARNLLTLLTNALVGADDIVKNCKSRCEAQHIPFYRFSPDLNITISSDETEDSKLVDMLIETRILAVREWLEQLDELVDLFEKVAAESREAKLMNLRKKRQKKMEDKLKVENSNSSQYL